MRADPQQHRAVPRGILSPIPLHVLVRRALGERRLGRLFDLEERHFWTGEPDLDLSVRLHGARAANPLGPAAGPHTQLAQNIALAYLGGARILELKTVQVNDRLEIPRPCIDMQTVGYNVEWSQELAVHESLREYVKAMLLVSILREAGLIDLPEGAADYLLDVSLGYSLDGIRSRKVTGFMRGVLDARALVEAERAELRRELPARWARLADAPCPERVSASVTLSTFHGCPAGEIEGICRHLIDEIGVHVIVKMNPTLLGFPLVREIVQDRLGYRDVWIKRHAFLRDLKWDEGVALVRELRAHAAARGLSFGAKFTNTLVVRNSKGFCPGEEMYLSGEPLHVIALVLAARFREAVGAAVPISFSAGIDAHNVADAVAAGLCPVTSSTDLLRPGGYGRMRKQVAALADAVRKAGARTVADFILRRAGRADGDVAAASLDNHRRAAEAALADPRYRAEKRQVPRKIGSRLALFDCVNCDKCVPVCPNDANFAYQTPARTVRYRDLVVRGGRLVEAEAAELALGGRRGSAHQLANFADACNDCGNCDVFCPEDGGPYIEKPRFHASRESLLADAPRPGFFAWRDPDGALGCEGRWSGHAVRLRLEPSGLALFWDGVAELSFAGPHDAAPAEARILTVPASAAPDGHVVPVGLYHSMRALIEGVFAPDAVSYVTAPYLDPEPAASARARA